MALINSDVVPFTGGAYEIEQSLRFNDDDSAYLSWTPSSEGNKKTWTYSAWVKLAEINDWAYILSAHTSGSNQTYIHIANDGRVRYVDYHSDVIIAEYVTSAKLRDPSSWYHIIVSVDTTNSTEADRVKIYINGSEVTDFDTTNTHSLNNNTFFGDDVQHYIGRRYTTDRPMDAYLSEVNFIDGQALDPTSFGETGTYGEWKPKAYTGTYGTNGFYLPFKQDYTVEGMSTVTYTGNASTQYIGGVGFQPDLVWIKRRDAAAWHLISDSVRGTTSQLASNSTNAELSYSDAITSFETDGFYLGDHWDSNGSGDSLVAWSWDMGGSNATNTNGSITSTVRANPTYGQSIVSYGQTTGTHTVGHGLSSAPDMVIIKNLSSATNWHVWHSSSSTAPLHLNEIASAQTSWYSAYQDSTAPTSSVFTVKSGSGDDTLGNNDYIAYCFHSVSGYSKFGSYTGNGSSTGPTVTTGFEPAFLMIKRTDSVAAWFMYDNVRKATNPRDLRILANTSDAEWDSNGGVDVDFLSTGFQLKTSDGALNSSSGTYIYMAFADTREFAYWLDASGNNNDWTSNNLTESDISVDSPTNNFATLNPLDKGGITLQEGNLEATRTSSTTDWDIIRSTIAIPSSGKWYWEWNFVSGSDDGGGTGVATNDAALTQEVNGVYGWHCGGANDYNIHNGSYTAITTQAVAGDIYQIAFDADNGKMWIGRNNTWGINGGTPVTPTDPNSNFTNIPDGLLPVAMCRSSNVGVMNFGQDSSFAGNKTAQGNTDSNGIGDFYYTPPSGYLALCTANLPDPAVIPSEHFNTVLYTGNGSTQSITGVGFQPDFVWVKNRSVGTDDHQVYDAVRTAPKMLKTNDTTSEITATNGITSFDSDGFTTGSSGATNNNGSALVSWNWLANGSGSSNTDGSITSTVSANQDAGFSIMTYTGNGSTGTLGHGLNQAPEMMIVKGRTQSVGWWVTYHKDLGNTGYVYINSSNGTSTNTDFWNSTTPTSTVCSVGNNLQVNTSGEDYIRYCFHSVEGYSKIGSYTGNGSTDGTFVYTGFRPAFVLVKYSSGSGGWFLWDSERGTPNPENPTLLANVSNAEQGTTGWELDKLSNGFKLRATGANQNVSGGTYIYLAMAEHPFKYTNAR